MRFWWEYQRNDAVFLVAYIRRCLKLTGLITGYVNPAHSVKAQSAKLLACKVTVFSFVINKCFVKASLKLSDVLFLSIHSLTGLNKYWWLLPVTVTAMLSAKYDFLFPSLLLCLLTDTWLKGRDVYSLSFVYLLLYGCELMSMYFVLWVIILNSC